MFLVPAEAQRIIVAPLNWGLGHATRSIPIIRRLVEQGKEVIIASDGEALELLIEEFPELPYHELPSYKVKYDHESLFRIVLSNSINIRTAIKREHISCKKLVEQCKADFVISDSRFGFRSSRVPSVIVTHQLKPISRNPLLKLLLNLGNAYYLNRFRECWVPDNEIRSLSGKLSENRLIRNASFIGPLSRLTKKTSSTGTKKYDLAILLSGPEPARTKLEAQLIQVLKASKKKICLVRGTTRASKTSFPEGWTILQLANSTQMATVIHTSKNIVSRSGYTSIMDYAHLGVGAFLIPTPGQSEQEYLAEYLDKKMGFIHIKEAEELSALI